MRKMDYSKKIEATLFETAFGLEDLYERAAFLDLSCPLKIIRLGMDTEAVIARFETERKALAMMEHPAIARVLDAGKVPAKPFISLKATQPAP